MILVTVSVENQNYFNLRHFLEQPEVVDPWNFCGGPIFEPVVGRAFAPLPALWQPANACQLLNGTPINRKKNKEQQQKNDSSPNEAFFYSSERLSQLKMAFYCNSRHHQAKAGLPMINMQDKWSPCLSWKVNSESHLRAYSNWSAVAGHILIWRSWPTASVHTNTRDSCQYMTLCLVSKILLFMKVMQYTWASKPRLQ